MWERPKPKASALHAAKRWCTWRRVQAPSIPSLFPLAGLADTLPLPLPPHSIADSMQSDEQPAAPSGPWRFGSALTMGAVGLLCRGFLLGLSNTEAHGLDRFLKLLDERENIQERQRGLITGRRPAYMELGMQLTLVLVSNHVSVYVRPTLLQTSTGKNVCSYIMHGTASTIP